MSGDVVQWLLARRAGVHRAEQKPQIFLQQWPLIQHTGNRSYKLYRFLAA